MTKQTLRYKRAIPMFLLAYVSITMVAVIYRNKIDVSQINCHNGRHYQHN